MRNQKMKADMFAEMPLIFSCPKHKLSKIDQYKKIKIVGRGAHG